MARHRREVEEEEDGWTRWVPPIMGGYKIACCDCGLTHDMQFRVGKITKRLPDGTWEYEVMEGEEWRVLFRARRNNRATAQVRRHKK